jgi:YVTN family beta-propeller protein
LRVSPQSAEIRWEEARVLTAWQSRRLRREGRNPFYGEYQSGTITPPPCSARATCPRSIPKATASPEALTWAPGNPFDIVVTPTAMYVASQAAGTVMVINPSSSKITATVTVGDSPYGIAVSP